MREGVFHASGTRGTATGVSKSAPDSEQPRTRAAARGPGTMLPLAQPEPRGGAGGAGPRGAVAPGGPPDEDPSAARGGAGPSPATSPSSQNGPQGHSLHPSLFTQRHGWGEQGSAKIHLRHLEAQGKPGSWATADQGEQDPRPQTEASSLGQSFTRSFEARNWGTPGRGLACTPVAGLPTP